MRLALCDLGAPGWGGALVSASTSTPSIDVVVLASRSLSAACGFACFGVVLVVLLFVSFRCCVCFFPGVAAGL